MDLGLRRITVRRGVAVGLVAILCLLHAVLYLEYEFGQRDFGVIAARVKDANPDLLFVGSGGVEANFLLEALKKLDYTPPRHFWSYPAPGPLAVAPEGKGAMAFSIFEEHPPFTQDPIAAEFVKAFRERATRATRPTPTSTRRPRPPSRRGRFSKPR